MKKLIFIFVLVLFSVSLFAQPTKGNGLHYFSGAPNTTPELTLGTEHAFDYSGRDLYFWNRVSSAWERYGKIEYAAGVPSGDPGSAYSGYHDTDSGKYYYWDSTASEWVEVGAVIVDPTTSPVLVLDTAGLKIDFSLIPVADTRTLLDSILIDNENVNQLRDSVLQISISDGDSTLQVEGKMTFQSSGTVIQQTLGGDTTNAVLVTNFRSYGLDPQQVDSLVLRITEEQSAIDSLSNYISSKPIRAEITNAGGQNIHVTYIGEIPTFTGDAGAYTLTIPDGTHVFSWRFGGGSSDNVWNGSGDLQFDIVWTGAPLSTGDINEYFANLQFTAKGNNEVLSDPKGQFSISMFQERTGSGTVQIRASNLDGTGNDGFKLTGTY